MKWTLPALLFLAACGPYSSYQTGRTLGAGEKRWDVGVAYSPSLADFRYAQGLGGGVELSSSAGFSGLSVESRMQVLGHGDRNSPLDVAVGSGFNLAGFSYSVWAQATASARLEGWSPYFTWRHAGHWFNAERLDVQPSGNSDSDWFDDDDDLDGVDIEDSVYAPLVGAGGRKLLHFNHYFFGAEIDVARGWFLAPEFSVVQSKDATMLGGVGIAFGRKF